MLRREAVHAVLKRLHQCFQPDSVQFNTPPKTVMSQMARLTVMVISDANKKHMLQFQPLIDMLLECLIIDDDNHRKGQDGADMLQEASASVLHELSLFGPGAAALRSHSTAVSTLRKLCEVGTKVSKERGAAALFEVEDGKRSKAAADSDDDGSGTGLSAGQQQKPPPHVMASYNWDHQDVILRVVTSLQDRGYLVWVDTEQMKGATVDTMALAVEGSEVVLIGVSRAYKESSNCRMEAQYALQKKKALVPLMMTEGYEADGWLGLLLGTSMWYGFYGETLSSVSGYETRMDALCREIGSRGRADAMVAASSPSVVAGHATSEAGVGDAMSDLEMELQELKLTALQKRALSAGAAESSMEDAMDSSDPKASLIGLIVDVESRRGPADRIRSCLEGGGEACAEMISDVLDHAMEVLEGLSVSSPRKSRKGLFETMEHVESRLETVVDAGWCDGVCRCGEEEMGRLSSLLVSARELSSSSGVSETSDAVTALLECLDRCGSVVVQSMAVLCGGSDASDPSSSSVLSALESLRCLSDERLSDVSADEAAAYEAVLGHLSGLDVCAGVEVVSSCMALHTLGCRNGLALCGRVDVLELACAMVCRWLEYASSGGDDYEAGGAVGAFVALTFYEGGTKMPSESRGPFEKAVQGAAKSMLGTVSKVFTEQSARKFFASSMKADVLSHQDISLACGCGYVLFCMGYMHPGALPTANESGVFSTALELLRRVEPSPLPGEWWSSTCDVVDVTSSQFGCVWILFGLVKRLPSAMQASWWSELLNHAIRLCKLNASVGLSERDTMCFNPFLHGFGNVELAALDESQHEMLIASGVADALEYGILHDFTYIGLSSAANASGAAVALVGRNEGGKVLRREAVHAVLKRLHQCFQPDTLHFNAPPKTVMAHMTRATVMVISDANKKHMLQFEPLIDMLLQCLIIDDDNHRKGQDGADMLQEASASVLHELSLFGPGAAALRSHSTAVSTLRKLCEVGTKVSKERGAAALFEVEDGKRPKAAAD
eukprot:COSAG06_NODE_1624_length_8892_cov_3872.704424_1_plen_1008_part_10